MASVPSNVDLATNVQKPTGSLPIYPAASVTVHVPYTGAHCQTQQSSATNRPVIQLAQVAPSLSAKQKPSVPVIQARTIPPQTYQSKYGELLNVIEDLGREIKPTYAGSKMAQERLKKGIMHARTLVRECLLEVDKSSRQ